MNNEPVKHEPQKNAGERTRDSVSKYVLGKMLDTEHAKHRFRELCERGADSGILGGYLLLLSCPTSKRLTCAEQLTNEHTPTKDAQKAKKESYYARRSLRIHWEERISARKSEFQDLPQELESLANRLEQLFKGASLVVPEKLSEFAGTQPESRSKIMVALYHTLPGLLRCYAQEVRMVIYMAKEVVGPKRYNDRSAMAAQLIAVIIQQTGNPNYDAIADLLQACSATVSSTLLLSPTGDEMPVGLLSADGLRQNYRRYLDRGFISAPLKPRHGSRKDPRSSNRFNPNTST